MSKFQCNTAVQVCSRIEHLASEIEGDTLSSLDALTNKVVLGCTVHVMLQKLDNAVDSMYSHIFIGIQAHLGACAACEKPHGASQCSGRGLT